MILLFDVFGNDVSLTALPSSQMPSTQFTQEGFVWENKEHTKDQPKLGFGGSDYV